MIIRVSLPLSLHLRIIKGKDELKVFKKCVEVRLASGVEVDLPIKWRWPHAFVCNVLAHACLGIY